MTKLFQVLLATVLLNMAAAAVADEATIAAAPANVTNIHLADGTVLSDNAPATVVVFEPGSVQQPENLLIVKAQSEDAERAVSLRLGFAGQSISRAQSIGGAGSSIELAYGIGDVTYLAHSGEVSLDYDGHRLRARVTDAGMLPLQAGGTDFSLSASFDARLELTCWVSRGRSEDGQAAGFHLDSSGNSGFCATLSLTDLLSD